MSRLKKLREVNCYTKGEIQKLTGIDQNDYSQLERGKRDISIGECMILAALFNTSMDYIAGLTDEPVPYQRSKKA